jgi:hypothetical protein
MDGGWKREVEFSEKRGLSPNDGCLERRRRTA